MEADQNNLFFPGLIGAIAGGALLASISVWMRRHQKGEIRAADLALGLNPFFVWLLGTEQVTKPGFGGVEVEIREAFLKAAGESVRHQVETAGGSGLVDSLPTAERASKGGTDLLPELVRQKIQGLEFHLGKRGYYAGPYRTLPNPAQCGTC